VIAIPSPQNKQLASSSKSPATEVKGFSDLNGNYSMDVEGSIEYLIVAGLPGYLSWRENTQDPNLLHTGMTVKVQPSGSSRIDLSLSKGAAIEGTISYDDGSPATGLAVDLIPVDPVSALFSRGVDPPQQTLTDDSGHYRIFGLPSGRYKVMTELRDKSALGENQESLKVYADGVISERRANTLKLDEGEQRSGIDIAIPLSSLYTVSGIVSSPDGRDATSGFVALESPSESSESRHAALTSSGSFSFSYVSAGPYCLKASHALYTRSAATSSKQGSDSTKPYCFQLNGDTNNLSLVTGPPTN
jgi:hypothetical protein